MKVVYVTQHGEKDSDGMLTEYSQQSAAALRNHFPQFTRVLSSDSLRAKLTLFSRPVLNRKSTNELDFLRLRKGKSDAIKQLAKQNGISFFEAADIYNQGELRESIENKAKELNKLIDETMESLGGNETALIVSHDLTIAPAMAVRGQPRKSMPYLCGYIINDSASVTAFDPCTPRL